MRSDLPRRHRLGTWVIVSLHLNGFSFGPYRAPDRQSPGMSPLSGVQRAHHVSLLTDGESTRQLASSIRMWIPAACAVEASVGSQLSGSGRYRNLDAGPIEAVV